MKFLLAAINAKYIHSNLGIYSLKKYADEKLCSEAQGQTPRIAIAEYTINHQMEYILQDIYKRNPDVVGFSCYIWNILYVKQLVRNLKKVRPDMRIWLGGPEVSYHAGRLLEQLPEVDGIMAGEGEYSFYRLVKCYEEAAHAAEPAAGHANEAGTARLGQSLSDIPGLIYRNADGTIRETAAGGLMDLNQLPFSYESLRGLEHRIIYYESSRGCPFSCSYCLSSIDKTVRFRDIGLVKKELLFFLEQKTPQVKFVDRTFNCKKSHAMEIWKFILEHDNGLTNFHFEISADLLDEEELALLEKMRPGLIQLEIGVQTTNARTIQEIRRSMDLDKVRKAVARVNSFQNIHQHLDLIAGLPWEDYESFSKSFDDVYRMEPAQLQLGFLKVLKGSLMEENSREYGLLYQSQPPYEVLCTKWLSYGDIIRLKGVEEMVEVYYNSGQFQNVIKKLERLFLSPFVLYETLAAYYEEQGLNGVSHNRLRRYEILYEFISGRVGEANLASYRDAMMFDLYVRENLKSRPSFAGDQSPYKERIKQFFAAEKKKPVYLNGYEQYDSRQMSKMTHVEAMSDGRMVLFDYKNRDALFGNAKAYVISE